MTVTISDLNNYMKKMMEDNHQVMPSWDTKYKYIYQDDIVKAGFLNQNTTPPAIEYKTKTLSTEDLVKKFRQQIDFINTFQNPDTLARYFEELGVKGRPRNAGNCAISKWLTEFTMKKEYERTGFGVRTGETSAFIALPNLSRITANFTVPVRDFIYHFDRDNYPKLIMDGHQYVW